MLKADITLNKKVYPFELNFNAIIEFEKLTSIALKDFESSLAKMGAAEMRAFVFCGIKEGARIAKKKFDVTIEDVGGWIDVDAMNQIGNLATSVMSDPKNQ